MSVFSLKDPKTPPSKPDGMSMMLKALGLSPDALMQMVKPTFEEAKALVTAFAESINRNHQELLARIELLHADVRALNPDHAGALDAPILTDDLATKIDQQHYSERSEEFELWLLRCVNLSYSDAERYWLEYRKNERANRAA